MLGVRAVIRGGVNDGPCVFKSNVERADFPDPQLIGPCGPDNNDCSGRAGPSQSKPNFWITHDQPVRASRDYGAAVINSGILDVEAAIDS